MEKKKLVRCVYISLRNEGVELLHEIGCEAETKRERGGVRLKRIRMVFINFTSKMIEILVSYDDNVIDDTLGLNRVLTNGELR